MRKLLICFDVDGTLIDDTVFIWQTIHDNLNTDPQEREFWAEAYWSKKITYAEWARKDVEMWIREGVDHQRLMESIDILKPMTGAYTTLENLAGANHSLGIISGSLDIALEKVFPDHLDMFEHIFLNHLEFDNTGVLTGIHPTPFDIEHKATGLKEIARRTEIPLKDTVFIGDNFNDVEVAKIAGCAIAFNCKSESLASVAEHIIYGNDLRETLPLIQAFASNGD